MSTRPDIPAEVRQFPQDYSAETLALVDATIERTRGEGGITIRRAIAELVMRSAAACDRFDAPVSTSEFVNGQAIAAMQIRAAILTGGL